MTSTPAARVSGWVCPPAVAAALLWSFLSAGAFLLVVFSYFEGFPIALFTLACFLLGMWKREYLFYLLMLQLPFWGKSPEYWQKPLLDINILVLLMLQCGVVLSRGRERRVYADPVFLLLAVLVLVAIIGAIPSVPNLWELARSQDAYQTYGMTLFAHPGFRFNVIRRLLSLLLCVGIFLYVRQQDEGFTERTVKVLMGVGVGIMAIGILKAMGWFEAPSPFYPLIGAYPWIYPGTSIRRAISVFGNPQWYAEYLVLLLPLFVAAAMKARSWRIIVFLLLALLCVLSAALTLLRMAWVATGGSIVLLTGAGAVLHRRGRVSPGFLYGSVAVLGCLVLTAFLAYHSLPQKVVFEKVKSFASTPRWELWKDSVSLIRKNPVVGYGIGSYMWAYEENIERERWAMHHGEAHNTYLTMGVEGGIAALAVFLAFLAYVLRSGFMRARDSLTVVGVVVGLLATFLFVAMTVNVFFLRGIESLAWVYFALAIGGAARKMPSHHVPASDRVTWQEFGGLRTALVLLVALALVLPGFVRFWPQSVGFYGWEVAPDGTKFRWSVLRSQMCEPVRGETFRLPVGVGHPDVSAERPLKVDLHVNGRVVEHYELDHQGGYELKYALGAGERAKQRIRIGLVLDRTWIWEGLPGVDERLLGLYVRELKWE